MAELEPVSVYPRFHFVLRVVAWVVVVPFAVLLLAFIAYIIVYLGIEHY